ncbi:nucleobase:cation symporter-2 family protein [Bailinhaonella thermotolerans]|uniref:Purine permease n=1 Tax=Bailinhaonella thermotolerans TaxID=1070861 RepID=A0A3A4B2P1_9ACTN|nr:nucleobase:cation symporter-2 family protein [Bailinhaonella thermotolerans]RJL35421.1 purine permease [Bailinhaonella thermotolerans]
MSLTRPGADAVDSVPRLRTLVPLSLQHVLIAYSGMVTVPLLIGSGIGLPPAQIAVLITANLFVSGVATLLQTLGVWKVGVRLPILMGSTFTGIGPGIIVGREGGLPAVFGATVVAGLLTFLAAPYFSRLLRFFPPVVTGSVIAIIGFSLVPSTASLIAGPDPAAPGYAQAGHIGLAAATILLVLLLERFAPAGVARLAVLIALVAGTLAALPLGIADFSQVGRAPLFGFVLPFEFGWPTFALSAVLPMVIVQLVNMVESAGDTLAMGQIAGRPVGPPEVAKALRADGAATAFAGVFNSFTIVTFGENVGLVSMTKVLSRYVVAAAGLLLVLLGLLPKLGAVIAGLPGPVLGGVGVVMFGMVGAVGLRILAQADLTDARNLLVIAISFGLGFLPVGAPHLYENFPAFAQTVLGSGIAAGGIAAFLLNLLLNETRRAAAEPA